MQVITSQGVCRSCGGNFIGPILDLGNQPLANRLLESHQLKDTEPTFPLSLLLCQKCKLLQLSHTVDPITLFSDYLYFSSTSDAFLAHARNAAKKYIEKYHLGKKSFVVEIASNDGYFLKNILSAGIPCLGIEPAKNISKIAEEVGVPTMCTFFSKKAAQVILSRHGGADLIAGNNVFAHIPDINNFIQAVSNLLKPKGVAVFEFPWAHSMVKNLEFDTIYHEHIFYFHALPLVPLLERHGLEFVSIDKLAIHGGSLRVHIAHIGQLTKEASVSNILAEEANEGVETYEYYKNFGINSNILKNKLVNELKKIKNLDFQIAAYGASAKGSTLLNFCGINREFVEFVVDRSQYKQGKFMAGTKIPIYPLTALDEKFPQVTLLLTWNFAQEILSQQSAYTKRGGKFLVPVPTPHFLP